MKDGKDARLEKDEIIKILLKDGCPFSVRAESLGMTPIAAMAFLRNAGYMRDAQPFELAYIQKNHGRITTRVLRETLGMTKTQFDQILRRYGFRNKRSLEDMAESEVIEQARHIVNHVIDNSNGQIFLDDLPRKLNKQHFTSVGGNHLIEYAEYHKKSDPEYKHWTAVAYLVCKAFPKQFMPFQFRHAKTNRYFDDRKNLMKALRWVCKKLYGHDLNDCSMMAFSRSFLSANELQYYGLGAYQWRKHFATKDEMVSALFKEYGVHPQKVSVTTRKLRRIVGESRKNVHLCAVPDCGNAADDVHHILQKSTYLTLQKRHPRKYSMNIDDQCNLVSLCSVHHQLAHRLYKQDAIAYKAQLLNSPNPDMLRPRLLNLLHHGQWPVEEKT